MYDLVPLDVNTPIKSSLSEYFLEIQKLRYGDDDEDSEITAIITSPIVQIPEEQCLRMYAYGQQVNNEPLEYNLSFKAMDGIFQTGLDKSVDHIVVDSSRRAYVAMVDMPAGTYRLVINISSNAAYFFIDKLELSEGICDHDVPGQLEGVYHVSIVN